MIYPNIRTEMERGGFTVSQLAVILGLPLNAFIYKLHGKCEFTLDEIELLADLFDCSLDYLVGHMGTGGRRREREGAGKAGMPGGCRFGGYMTLPWGDDYNGIIYGTKITGHPLKQSRPRALPYLGEIKILFSCLLLSAALFFHIGNG